MKERIGVTGSHGFIGEKLVSRLNDFTYTKRLSRQGFIPANLNNDLNKVELEPIIGVIDLASYGNYYDQRDKIETYVANTMRVIEMSKYFRSPLDFYIYVSTSSVKLDHQTYYSASKRATEEYLRVFSKEKDFPIAIVRPYSVTGPGEQEKHLIPTLIRAAHTGEEIPFVPKPVHDFVDVRDFVDALLLVSDNIKYMRADIIEVGSGEQYSNESVRQMVEIVTGKEVKTREVESMRSYDTDKWVADTQTIRGLGWEPKYSILQSITDLNKEYERQNS